MPVDDIPSVEDYTGELVALLPESMTVDEEGRLAAEGILTPVAHVSRYFEIRREKLLTWIGDPDNEEWTTERVRFLASNLGWGDDLSIARQVTGETLKKLLPSAVALWKQKGTTSSWRTMATVTTGLASLILTWFELRTLDQHRRAIYVIPEPGDSGSPYEPPDLVSDIWYMDPDGPAQVLPDLLVLLDSMRPSGERLNVRPALLVEDLLQSEAVWGRLGGSASHSYTLDSSGGRLSVSSSGDGYFLDLDEAPGFTEYRLIARLSVAGEAIVYLLTDTNGGLTSCYRVEIDAVSDLVTVSRVDGGSPTVLDTFPATITPGYDHDWTFLVAPNPTVTSIRVELGAVEVGAVDDTAGSRKSAGGVAWVSATGEASLTFAMINETSPPEARVGPS